MLVRGRLREEPPTRCRFMGSIHHANAKTTVRVRQEIQDSKKSIIALSKQYNLNPKTIMKWKNADRVTDVKSGPSIPKSIVLTVMEEQIICEFRRTTHFSLDVCLYFIERSNT